MNFQKYPISSTQISIIEGLLTTSILTQEEIFDIENNLLNLDSMDADFLIDRLNSKQVCPIESGNSYTQTDIKNKLKTIK